MSDNLNLPFTRRGPGPALASTIALFGALGLMGVAPSAMAGAVAAPAPAACGPVINDGTRSSQVTDFVTDNNDGTWTYEFRVCNTSDSQYGNTDFVLRDWELPWDPNAAIIQSSITTPGGWSWSVETRDVENLFTGWDGDITWQEDGDPFFDPLFAHQPEVLHFYTSCGEGAYGGPNTAILGGDVDCRDMPEEWLFSGDERLGFSFTASASPVAAPYQASWLELPPRSGDPAFPLTFGTALTPSFFATSVPEPSSLLLLGASLGGLGAAALARRRKRDDEAPGGA